MERLDDHVLARIIELLGFQDALCASRTCRRFREAALATAWKELVIVESVEGLDGPRAMRRLEELAERVGRQIKLAPEAAVRVYLVSDASLVRRLDVEQLRPLGRLLKACAAAGGLREVAVEVPGGLADEALARLALDGVARGESGRGARAFASLRIAGSDPHALGTRSAVPGWLLRLALAPFPALAALSLSRAFLLDTPAAAAALAAACPALRRLDLACDNPSPDPALAALAALSRLERLAIRARGPVADAGLAALAAGPSAASLRALDFSCGGGLVLGGPGLRALARLTALEALEGPVLVAPSGVGRGDVAALAACGRLERLELALAPAGGAEDAAGPLLGLADAAAGLKRLRRLLLAVRTGPPGDSAGEAAAAAAALAACAPALRRLHLEGEAPLARPVAEALRPLLASLEALALQQPLARAPGRAAFDAYRIVGLGRVHPGLSLQVTAGLDGAHTFAEARAALAEALPPRARIRVLQLL